MEQLSLCNGFQLFSFAKKAPPQTLLYLPFGSLVKMGSSFFFFFSLSPEVVFSSVTYTTFLHNWLEML